jgi:hypothetical protein
MPQLKWVLLDQIELRGGRRFAVTVDDPAPAPGLLDDLSARGARMRFHGHMDLEERTLEDTLEQSCTVCGAKLTSLEIEAAREAGGPFLCSVHAAEELPAEDVADETPGEPD